MSASRSGPALRPRLHNQLLAIVLLASLVVLLPVPAALADPAAMPAQGFAITLTDVFVSQADATTPGNPPAVAHPGGKFKIWYRITNPYETGVRVGLGASIVGPGAVTLIDPAGEPTCDIPPQTSFICTRDFNVRGDAPLGTYRVRLGIGNPTPGSASIVGNFELDNWVQVQAAPPPAQPTATPTPVTPPAPALPQGPGRHFPETGYWVRDGVSLPDGSGRTASFLAEFERLGGISTLGYPASRPFWREGFLYQVFQRGILQWRPDYSPPQAVLANTMDWLYQAGKDNDLAALGIPRHFAGDEGAGGSFQRAREIRFAWMTDPLLREAYFANPNPDAIPSDTWDPVTFYGLPTSQPERHGPFTAQRFQRYVLQKWEQSVPGMPPAGTVVGVLAGDLAKQLGLVPSQAMEIERP